MKWIYCLSLLFTLVSCKNEKQEEKESIEKTLNVYFREKGKDIDSTLVLDSVRIIKIDSVSSKGELAMKINKFDDSLDVLIKLADLSGQRLKLEAEQYKLLKYMGTLSSSKSDLKIFEEGLVEKQNEFKQSIGKAERLKKEVDSLREIYNQNKIDSLNFLFYNVKLKACFTNNKMEQKCFDSLSVNVTKNYRIKK